VTGGANRHLTRNGRPLENVRPAQRGEPPHDQERELGLQAQNMAEIAAKGRLLGQRDEARVFFVTLPEGPRVVRTDDGQPQRPVTYEAQVGPRSAACVPAERPPSTRAHCCPLNGRGAGGDWCDMRKCAPPNWATNPPRWAPQSFATAVTGLPMFARDSWASGARRSRNRRPTGALALAGMSPSVKSTCRDH